MQVGCHCRNPSCGRPVAARVSYMDDAVEFAGVGNLLNEIDYFSDYLRAHTC